MRYYDLSIYPPPSSPLQHQSVPARSVLFPQKIAVPPKPILHFSSHVPRNTQSGSYPKMSAPTDIVDPGALEISFSFTQNDSGIAEGTTGGAHVTIKGIDITTINQASNLVGHTLILKAGMGKGLPLSNPNQVGTILHGTIQSSLGNWTQTELSITFFVTSYQLPHPVSDAEKTAHLIHCAFKDNLKDAIRNAFRSVVHNPIITFNSTLNPIAKHDFIGSYPTLKELCVACSDSWQQTTGMKLTITTLGNHITFSDQTEDRPVKNIDFSDLIGQPSWNGVNNISVTCPLRGDLKVRDTISLPHGASTVGVSKFAKPLPKDKSLFSGLLEVTSISYLGDFRSPQGEQWATTIHCSSYA
ncbi:hypothetical protein [Saccharibacter floricola]|nr:hypothetical protein [Saccharibacter floricola]